MTKAMKNNSKKLIIALLICVIATSISILHVSAESPSDNVTASYIWIGNVKLENGQYLGSGESVATTTSPTDNYAHYEDGVLTLKNYSYSGEGTYNADGYEYYDAINCSTGLKIKLEGTNSINLQRNQLNEFSYGIIVGGNFEISSVGASASLSVSGVTGDALYVDGNVRMQDVTVSLSADENGLQLLNDLTVINTNLTIISANTGLACSNFDQEGGVVDITAGGIGINASQNVNINSGKMVAKTTSSETNGNHVAIGSSVNQFNYDSDNLQIIVSHSSTGAPTEEYNPQNVSSYRYVMVIAKEIAPKPSYYVSFEVNGLGVDIPKQLVVLGGKVKQPDEPQVDAYQFVGWYKDAECKNVWKFDSDVVTGPITLYAKWLEKSTSHVHEPGLEWRFDNTNHWHVCVCSEKLNLSPHSFYSEGKCVVCGFKSLDLDTGNNNLKYIIIIGIAAIFVIVGVTTVVLIKAKKKRHITQESDTLESTSKDTVTNNTVDRINKEDTEEHLNEEDAEKKDSNTD